MFQAEDTLCSPATNSDSIRINLNNKAWLRWIGYQRHIYNAKVWFARHMVGTARKPILVDQRYHQFITDQTPILREAPSRVWCNGAVKFRPPVLPEARGTSPTQEESGASSRLADRQVVSIHPGK